MSTDGQQYSLSYQRSTIAAYAERHNFTIVKTYADPGRSGLWLRNRPGLTAILRDVVANDHEFDAILVYDVSRWGRFQDADEAGHYEFLCKSNGIQVHYCAEQFANDNSLPSILFKTLKRTLAAEYSRELSVRVGHAMKHLAERGWWTGSTPGYGFRRMLVLADGTPKEILQRGEQKALRAGTVTLVHGPKREIQTVRWIYEMLLAQHLRPSEIVKELRRKQISHHGRPWSFFAVTQVLTNPKYAGVAVWGRTEVKLRSTPVHLPRDRWVVKQSAFPGIVSMQTFLKAQKVYYDRTDQKSNEQLLGDLRCLWKKEGMLGELLVDVSNETASVNTYRRRFGSLAKAFQLVGYKPSKKRIYGGVLRSKRRFARMRDDLVRRLSAMFPKRVVPGYYRGFLRLPHAHLDVAVYLCPANFARGYPIWSLTPRSAHGLRSPLALICLLNRSNDRIKALYVSSPIDGGSRSRIYSHSDVLRKGERLSSLRHFYQEVLKAAGNMPPQERLRSPEAVVGVPQIARCMGQSPARVRRWIREGMPTYRHDRFLRASASEVREWAEKNGRPYVWRRDKLGRFLPGHHRGKPLVKT
jgi:DNA invertase Pin-like site-specific DNA recombinase